MTASKFKIARLTLSGVILGVAFAGLVSSLFGYPATFAHDVIGGSLGAAGVLAFKVLHLV